MPLTVLSGLTKNLFPQTEILKQVPETSYRMTGRKVRMTGREVRMTGREVRMTDDRTSIAEMPIRIQSVTKGMRTVVMTKR